MSRLSQLAALAFNRAWAVCNKPTMTVVGPVTGWSLPAGASYDPTIDRVVDRNGAVIEDCSAYWTTTSVNVIPAEEIGEAFELGPAGISEAGSSAVVILPGSVATCKAAFCVILSGEYYNISQIRTEPPGALTPTWAIVALKRRK